MSCCPKRRAEFHKRLVEGRDKPKRPYPKATPTPAEVPTEEKEDAQ